MKVDEDVVWCPVEGELVLFHSSRGLYYGLNNVGAEIWRLLADGTSAAAVVAQLQSKYDVDESTAVAEVERLTKELTNQNLIVAES